MSSEKFENVQEDFQNICQEIKRKLENKYTKTTGEEKKKLQREIQNLLEEAESLLLELDNEVRAAPNPFRNQMAIKVKHHRQDLSQLSMKLNQMSYSETKNRQELFSAPLASGIDPVEANQRVRVLQTNKVMKGTSDRVLNTQRIAAQTDNVAHEVVSELGHQRDTLVRTKDRLIDTDLNLSRSRKILQLMQRRIITNKLILCLIILVEIGILIGIVYERFIK